MIVVVCLNPALDITHHVPRVDWAGVNRPVAVHARPGGKGVNVARTLHALGTEVLLLGLAGGPTGSGLEAALHELGVPAAFTRIAGDSRRTFTVVDGRGPVALFNEPGPEISAAESAEFRAQYRRSLDDAARKGAAAVVLSGSLPPGLPADAYATLIDAARAAGVPAVLDTSGAALRHGIAAGPAIVKPNRDELTELTVGDDQDGGRLGTLECAKTPTVVPAREVAAAAASLRLAGAESVVVSLGAAGLLAETPDGCWQARPAAVVTGNATGAGDAVTAALAHGLLLGRPWPERLAHAVALGAATVAAPVAGEFSHDDYAGGLRAATVSRPGHRGAAGWPAAGPSAAGTEAKGGR